MYAKNMHYTEDDFEKIQANYNGKAEYSNGYIVLSSNTSIAHNKINIVNILKELQTKKYRTFILNNTVFP